LGHILEKSAVGATINIDTLPLSEIVKTYIAETNDWRMPLTAGDDYQLCFTISPDKVADLTIDCWQIGVIETQVGLRILREGQFDTLGVKGFEHFS
jgi:thiamine-monophosphate kinase